MAPAVDGVGERALLYGRAMLLCAVLIALSRVLQGGGQDILPFVVAARMLQDGASWHDAYLMPGARSLFDVTPAYQAAVASQLGTGTDQKVLTAFVAPPPAVTFGWLWTGLDWDVVRPLLILLLTVPVVWAAWRAAAATPGVLQSGAVWLVSSLVVFYAAHQAQLSLLALPAAAGLLSEDRRGRLVGAGCLGALVVVKIGPLVVLPFLWWAGRRREVGIAASVVVVLLAAGTALAGTGGWDVFLSSLRQISAHTVVEKTNASPDALFAVLVEGSGLQRWHDLSSPWDSLATGLRLGSAGWFLWRARSGGPADRVAAGWLVWLCLTPLHWVHYHTALVPLLAARSAERPLRSVLLGVVMSAPIAVLLLGDGHDRQALVAGAIGWLILVAAWPPPAGQGDHVLDR